MVFHEPDSPTRNARRAAALSPVELAVRSMVRLPTSLLADRRMLTATTDATIAVTPAVI